MVEGVVFPGPGKVQLAEVDLPAPGAGQVRVRTRVSLLSTGTETTAFSGRFDEGTHWASYVRYPFRPGYACVGEVVAAGAEVTDLPVGRRVVTRAPHAGEHLVDAARCTAVPDDLDDERAAWFALAKIAFVGALAAQLRLGVRVLVVGAGPVGQMATRWAVAAGAGAVVVADVVTDRLALAAAGGATGTANGPVGESGEAIRAALGGRPPDIVIDSTGNAAVFASALGVVADHGRVVVLGDAGSPASQRLTSDLLNRGITVVGAHDRHTAGDPRWDGDREIFRLFFRLASQGRFPLDGLISHRFRPQDCVAAYELAEHHRETTMGILFDWRGSAAAATHDNG